MQDDALRALFPTLTDDELRLAAERLDQYLVLAWEIMEGAEGSLDPPRIPGQDSNVGKVEHKI